MAKSKNMIQLMEEAVENIDKLNALKEALIYQIQQSKEESK